MKKRGGASASAEGTMARTSEQDFRILFTTHPTPMWVYDPETLRFIVMNDAAYRLYGYTADEIPAMTVLDIRRKPSGTGCWPPFAIAATLSARSGGSICAPMVKSSTF
jgi:hypothetical protein